MLEMSEELLQRIREHGARAYPNECCGALLGRAEPDPARPARLPGGQAGGCKRVLDLMPLDNRRHGEAARTRFLVTADDYRLAEQTARNRQLEILGFYHSHPDHPARPSEFDREHALPWYSYIVVRVTQGQLQEATSWVLAEDRSRFNPEPIVAPAPVKSTEP
ncbi:MAG: Mov34/MPN/PAD-1 family protein [Terriglobia bacterium]